MVNYFYEEQQYDQNLFNQYFDVAKSSTLDVLGDTFTETLYYNPASALFRLAEQHTYDGTRGRVLSKEEYMEIVPKKITEQNKEGVYKYLNFHQVSSSQLTNLVHS